MADILIAGIAVVDAIARPVDAFPAPGGLRFFDNLTITTGGCAINCSLALAKLGVTPALVARIGRDPLGDFVLAELTRHRVPTANVVRDEARSTSFSFVAVPSGGERSFLHTTGANAALSPADFDAELFRACRIAFITGAMLMDSLDGPPTAGIMSIARQAGARTILDTVFVEALPRAQWLDRIAPALPYLDYFIPSEPEALAISGSSDPQAAAAFFHSSGARNVVIKLGARGVFCSAHDGHRSLVPAITVPNVVDATGAGDCWSAGFLLGLSEGRSFTDSARLGNAVAAIGIQSPGATTGIQSRAQVDALMHA